MIIPVLVGVFVLWASTAWATDRYVDATTTGCSSPTDTDYNPATESCGSGSELVYTTINGACAAESPADTIYVRAGTYIEYIADCLSSGTSATALTSLIGWPGETVIVRPASYGGGFGCAIHIGNTRSFILVQNIDFRATNCSGGASVRIGNSANPTPRPNYIILRQIIASNNPIASGILAAADNFEVSNSEISSNGDSSLDHGFYWSAGSVGTFLRNRFENNSGVGVQFYKYSTHGTFKWNFCKGNGAVCLAMGGDTETISYNVMIASATATRVLQLSTGEQTVRNSVVSHNVFYRSGTASGTGFLKTRSGTLTASNNIAIGFTTGFSDTTSTWTLINNRTSGTATDIWTSPSSDNFTLKAGSVAIDAGTSCGGAYNGSSCDQGAHEVPVFSSCAVSSGATSVVRVTFTNNLSPPMLPASSVTGVTFRKNGASNAVVSSARVGDNIYDFTVTSAYVGGDTVDLSLAPGSTNLTDSALVGNTRNQPFITTLTNQSCTNNAGGAPAHTFTQAAFELHDWRGLEAAPVMLPHGLASTGAAENFANYQVRTGGRLRVRFAIVCGGGVNCPDSAFYPYVSIGAAYVRVLDTFGDNNIKMCGDEEATDLPANGTATTNQLSTGGTFVAGGVLFTSNAIPTIAGLNNGYKTEMEYCFALDTDAVESFDLRMYLEDGTALNTYTNTPRLVSTPTAAGGAGF